MLAEFPLQVGVLIHTCENILESELNVACIERGGFNKGKVVLACEQYQHRIILDRTEHPYLQTALPLR